MNVSWLDQLAPDHAPAATGWWPPAPGWWALALLIVLLAAGLMRVLHDPHRRLRRTALRELRSIRTKAPEARTAAAAIESLLRRYAVAVFGRDRVAALSGEAWLTFLGNEGGEILAGESGRSLLVCAFGGRTTEDRDRWLAGADAFIRRAARPKRGERAQDTERATPLRSTRELT